MNNFDERFPESDVMSCFGVFNKDLIKKELNKDNIYTFGIDQINMIKERFNQGQFINKKIEYVIDNRSLIRKWRDTKDLLFHSGYINLDDPFLSLFQVHKDLLPNVYKIYKISIVLPVSTSVCEQGFSIQNLI